MSRNISLFSGYAQKENRTTNYCLLILKMLYEENPKRLSEVLSAIVGEDLGDHVGVQFRQQTKKGGSIPDGLILQRPFTIFIETKNWDWFYDRQIERYLQALDREQEGVKILLALGNFESLQTSRFAKIEGLCQTEYRERVKFAAVGFDELLEALRSQNLPKNLSDAISDFGAYLDEQGLLPTWERRLDVVNCAGIPQEILQGHVYLCPATGGAYNHSRSRFFGMYKNKRVSQVALIEAMVELWGETEALLKWKHVDRSDEELIFVARERHVAWRRGQFPTRVFVLGELFETDFVKDTPRGMLGSKQYFTVDATTAKELAERLRGQTWSSWRG